MYQLPQPLHHAFLCRFALLAVTDNSTINSNHTTNTGEVEQNSITHRYVL